MGDITIPNEIDSNLSDLISKTLRIVIFYQ